MSEPIHDDELDTSERVVRLLLAAQCPAWAGLPLSSLRTSGTDNAMWRVTVPEGGDVVVRLPRRARPETDLDRELQILQAVAAGPLAEVVATPVVRHVGEPTDAFRCRWAVLGWIEGADAWTARRRPAGQEALAGDLATAVGAIGALEAMPAPHRAPGQRGGPLGPLLDGLERWLDPRWDPAAHLDVAAVRRSAAECRAVTDEPVVPAFVHGDLIPGNLLLRGGRLSAIIDWTSAAIADPAQDLTPAWAVFDEHDRAAFREAVGVDEATWLRARANALQQAVAGVVYYTPRRHPLGEVMARTLQRILTDR